MKAAAIAGVIIRGRGGVPCCMTVHRKGAGMGNALGPAQSQLRQRNKEVTL